MRRLLAAGLLLATALASPAAGAQALKTGKPGHYLGPESCMQCHKAQYEVWKASKHSTSVKTVHREAIVPDLLAGLGQAREMKQSATCRQCHYTVIATPAPEQPAETAGVVGVSCEHCHGAASGWIKVHQDFGGPPQAETAAHKARRIAAAKAAGMVYPSDYYTLATRCVQCHLLTNPNVDAATLAKMVHLNHPFNENYELVKYSQGTVRHRFYPPDLSVNREMTPAELARLYATGQAAKLVSAHAAWARAHEQAYRDLEAKQVEAAKKALSALKDVPQAQALLEKQDVAAVRAFLTAIADKDLSAELADQLPKKSDYR